MDQHTQDYACRQVCLPGIEAWYLLQCICNTFLSYKRSFLTSYSWKKGVEDRLWFNWWILSVGGTVYLKFSGPSYFVQTAAGLTLILFVPCIANWSTNLSVPTNWLFYTGCPGRNVPDFGRMFLKLKYTDITKNTYIRSWTVTEIMARERCGLLAVPCTVPGSRDV